MSLSGYDKGFYGIQYVLMNCMVNGHFNLEHFDKYLMKTLMPAIYIKGVFDFENLNYLCEKDIKSLEFFSDYFIDIDLREVRLFSLGIYPESANSDKKYKLENIEILLKFIKTITEEL